MDPPGGFVGNQTPKDTADPGRQTGAWPRDRDRSPLRLGAGGWRG